METASRTRSTRDRPAKAPLSEAAIVEAALAITRAEGLEAVTMRRVAAELDTGAASLYAYVRNRDDLLRAMLGRIATGVSLVTPDPARWREQAHELLGGWRAALEAHPGLASALPGELLTSESALEGAESLLGILLAGGVAVQDAAWACDILTLLVTATAAEADARRAAGQSFEGEAEAAMQETFAGLPAGRFPLLVRHAAELVAGSGDDRFRFAVDTILTGLLARTARA